MSDDAYYIDTDAVFEAVGGMRTSFYWDGTYPVIEPPDLGDGASNDYLWRLSNLVGGLRGKAADEFERGAKAIIEGAIDTTIADEAPEEFEVASGTTTAPTTTAVSTSPAQPASASDSEPATATSSSTTTTTTTTTTLTTD